MAQGKPPYRDLFGNPVEEPAPDRAAHISPAMEQYREYLDTFTVEKLNHIRACLGFEFRKGNKAALLTATLVFLTFLEEEKHFQEWFESLPLYLSRAIAEASFRGYIEAEQVEKLAGKPVSTGSRYNHHYYRFQPINPDLRLGIFDFYTSYGQQLLFMKPVFRRLMTTLLPKPPGYSIGPGVEQERTGWSVADTLSEPLPLLLKSIEQIFTDSQTHESILRRGLNKQSIRNLRKSTAFPSFPGGEGKGPDPIDLIARFLMIDPTQMERFHTEDVRDFIKGVVTTFFVIPPSRQIRTHYLLVDSSFEFSVLCPHVSRSPGSRRDHSFFLPHPWSRSLFYKILNIMAGTVAWYRLDEMVESIRMQTLPFTILQHEENTSELVVKGEELTLPEGTIKIDLWEKGFEPDIYLIHALIAGPLLRGYCYLMASLGILEIDEEEPEKLLVRNGKRSPISPFDGLVRARITPFGTWCLGVSQEKPPLRTVSYEAIADRELPLVTYRGRSVECKVFLERIGDPIGENRFRISEASLIRDCRTAEEIEHRIGEFHRLISDDPAPHWEELFSRVRNRSRLFADEEPCIMIQLPEERELRRLFLEEKKLSSLVVRAEGGRIVVTRQNYYKLRKALEEYGVLGG